MNTEPDEYQPRTAERLIEILKAWSITPRSWQREAAAEIERLTAENERLRDWINTVARQPELSCVK